MIVDKSLVLGDAIGSDYYNAGTYYATNWIDLSTVGTQLYGEEPYLVVRVGTAWATGTSLTFSLISTTAAATDVAGTNLGTVTVELVSPTIATADLTANTNVWEVRLPKKIARRYLGVKIVSVESSDFTTGTLDIFIVPDLPTKAYG